jgi:hypothetical protein
VAKEMKLGRKRGQLQQMAMLFIGLISAGFVILVFMYTGQVLAQSFNASCGLGASCANNTTRIWYDIMASTVNFTSQLGTVGTIAGVMLLLALIGGAGLWMYGKTKGGGDSGM